MQNLLTTPSSHHFPLHSPNQRAPLMTRTCPFTSSHCLLLVGSLLTMMLGAGCKTQSTLPDGPFVESTQAPDPERVEHVVVPVPYAQPVPGQAKLYPPAEPSPEEIEAATKRPAHEIIDEANVKAAQQPTEEGYFNAIQTYDYMDGALYQVYSAPNHLTVISFGQGERVLSYAAGDTIHWIVEKTESGPKESATTHLLVEPIRSKLHTDLLVTTDCCVYTFELKSFQHTRMSRVRFLYPQRQLTRLQRQASAKQRLAEESSSQGKLAVSLDQIETRYDLIVKDKKNPPHWTPTRVFHDGKRTFIEFPDDLGSIERPALFLLDDKARPQIQQHAVEGRYYIIPRVVTHAMLRLGDEKSQSVGIELAEEARP